jgi:hypothetical protein
VFPADNAWNRDVSADQVDPNSDNYIANIGPTIGLHPDFSNDPGGGIPYVVVPGSQPKVPITFDSSESDLGPYPIPDNPPIETGSDHHLLIIDSGECYLYEVFLAAYNGNMWTGSSGAIWHLQVDWTRPAGWTSADAAGLPIFPGLVRYDEIAAGEIKHALRFTTPRTQRGYIAPASHFASSSTDANLPPMGLRVRLKQGVDISGFSPNVQVLLRALKTYGLLLADNGSAWYITGAPDSRWNNDEMHTIGQIHGSDFEVVQSGEIQH